MFSYYSCMSTVSSGYALLTLCPYKANSSFCTLYKSFWSNKNLKKNTKIIVITHRVTRIITTLGSKKDGDKTLQLRWRCLSQQPTRYAVSATFVPVCRPWPTRCGFQGYVGRQALIRRTLRMSRQQ